MGNANSGFVTYNDLSKYAKKTDLENMDLSMYTTTANLKKNTMWCADGNLCEVPKNIRSLNIQNPDGKITQFGGTGENYIFGKTTIDNLYSINGMDLAAFKSSLIGPEGKQGPPGKDGKDGGLTFEQIQNNNFSKLQTDTLNAGRIGNADGATFVSGYGGFSTGYGSVDANGNYNTGDLANSLTRDGINLNRGNIMINPSGGKLCIKDWCIEQNGNGNLAFTKAGNSGVYELDKTNDSRWVGWTSNSSNTSYGGVYGGVGARV